MRYEITTTSATRMTTYEHNCTFIQQPTLRRFEGFGGQDKIKPIDKVPLVQQAKRRAGYQILIDGFRVV